MPGPSHDPTDSALEGEFGDLRRRTERWFIHKGLPHLIEGYGATTGVMTRMIPALVVLFFLETNLVFGDRFAGWAQVGVWCGSAGFSLPERPSPTGFAVGDCSSGPIVSDSSN